MNMSTGVKIALGSVLFIVTMLIGTVMYVMGAKFAAETYEQSIFAQDEQMQNVHGVMKNALKMQGFTVNNYSKTHIDAINAAVDRYADKPNLMMQFVKESQSTMPTELHTKFMDSVEKFYAKWEASQTSKISVAQEYRTFINASVKGTVAKVIFSYPSEKATKIMDRIISSKESKETWKTGEDVVEDPFSGGNTSAPAKGGVTPSPLIGS